MMPQIRYMSGIGIAALLSFLSAMLTYADVPTARFIMGISIGIALFFTIRMFDTSDYRIIEYSRHANFSDKSKHVKLPYLLSEYIETCQHIAAYYYRYKDEHRPNHEEWPYFSEIDEKRSLLAGSIIAINNIDEDLNKNIMECQIIISKIQLISLSKKYREGAEAENPIMMDFHISITILKTLLGKYREKLNS